MILRFTYVFLFFIFAAPGLLGAQVTPDALEEVTASEEIKEVVRQCEIVDTINTGDGTYLYGVLTEKLDTQIKMNGDEKIKAAIEKLFRKNLKMDFSTPRLENFSMMIQVDENDKLVSFYNGGYMLNEMMAEDIESDEEMTEAEKKEMTELLGLITKEEQEKMEKLIKKQRWQAGTCNGKPTNTIVMLELDMGK